MKRYKRDEGRISELGNDMAYGELCIHLLICG